MPLNTEYRKLHAKCEKKTQFYFGIFLSLRWKEIFISYIVVYYSVKKISLDRLYESMESYPCHFGLGTLKFYIKVFKQPLARNIVY